MSAVVTWCESCQHDVADDEIAEDGACPQCGTILREERRPIPWTFKLMIVATVVYLGYRAYQGVGWLVHHV